MMPDVKRLGNDSGFATGWTTQSQTTSQHPLDLFKICFQSLIPYYVRASQTESGDRKLDSSRGLR